MLEVKQYIALQYRFVLKYVIKFQLKEHFIEILQVIIKVDK